MYSRIRRKWLRCKFRIIHGGLWQKEMNSYIGPTIKLVQNIVTHVMHIFSVCPKHKSFVPIGPIQPLSPSTKELHGKTNHVQVVNQKQMNHNICSSVVFETYQNFGYIREHSLLRLIYTSADSAVDGCIVPQKQKNFYLCIDAVHCGIRRQLRQT